MRAIFTEVVAHRPTSRRTFALSHGVVHVEAIRTGPRRSTSRVLALLLDGEQTSHASPAGCVFRSARTELVMQREGVTVNVQHRGDR